MPFKRMASIIVGKVALMDTLMVRVADTKAVPATNSVARK
jgi:hypothetical protein